MLGVVRYTCCQPACEPRGPLCPTFLIETLTERAISGNLHRRPRGPGQRGMRLNSVL